MTTEWLDILTLPADAPIRAEEQRRAESLAELLRFVDSLDATAIVVPSPASVKK